MPLTPGSRLGPYEVLSALGAGGMGEVYRARDTRLSRDVAIKVLPDRLAQDREALSRFEREAKAVAALSHPNILAIHDFGREGGVAYSVTELLEGETLGEALSSGPLSPRKAAEYGVQIARGLAAAHEKGIVHRDLKPDNVFVTRDDRLKILDFGLAKAGGEASPRLQESRSPTVSAHTEPGTVMGTVGYMSPEQVRGQPADARSDIFSFGSLLYEMLSGRRPFQRETAAETMTAILREDPPDPGGTARNLPLALDSVLRRCLEKKPEKRFQSASDLAFALEMAAGAASGVAPAGGPLPGEKAAPRVPVLVRGAILAALLSAAALGGYLLRRAPASPAQSELGDATLTPLTTDAGYEGEPTFSPDGRTIAYVSDRDGNFEIYLQQISGGTAINLTRNAAADIQPAFSPDGREIAFVSDRSGKSEVIHAGPGLPLMGGDIWIMPALGGPARRIVENGNCPSWTPDGSEIFYVHGSYRSPHIARVASSGGESRDVPIEEPFANRYFFPSVSEDGRWLLYQSGPRVEVVAVQGGKPRVLARGESPAWGAGSRSILFTNGAPGKGRTLWQAPFSAATGELDGPPRALTFGGRADLGGKASRDGSTIAFSAVDETLNLEEVPFDAEAGRVTGSPRELTSGNNRVGFFDPAPDGSAAVFGAARGALSHLWRVDTSSPPLQLTQDSTRSDINPRWSPDGRQIAFNRTAAKEGQGAFPRLGEEQELWIMSADGASPRRVAEIAGPSQVAWLPDSSRVLVQRGESLLEVDLASGAATPIAGVKVRTLFTLDEEGKWLAYQTSEGGPMGLAAKPLEGGAPRRIVTGPYEAYHPFFSPSGRWLYFQPNHRNLFRVPGPAQDWKTAPPEKVTDFTGTDLYIDDPKISRDGKKLFYIRGRRTGDLMVLQFGAPGGGRKGP